MTFNRPTHKVINASNVEVFEGSYQQCLRLMVDTDDSELVIVPINSLHDEPIILGDSGEPEVNLNEDDDEPFDISDLYN